MRARTIATIARREYLARVTSKGFWIATLVLPLFMAAMVFVPTLVMMRAKASHRLAVVDATGTIGQALKERLERGRKSGEKESLEEMKTRKEAARFVVEVLRAEGDPTAQKAQLDRRILEGGLDSWIFVDAAAVEASRVEYRAESVSNFLTQRVLENALSQVLSRARLVASGFDPETVSRLTRGVDLETVRVSKEGSRAEGGMAGFFFAYFLFFLLYMVVAIYGQQVLNGVIEEKTSRVVEVILATVRPFELMLGKLAGIGLAGLTQLAIWLAAMVVLSAPTVIGALAWVPAGGIPTVSATIVVNFLALFFLGYFFFAALYAAIGSAVNNVQEAQQLAGVVVVFLVGPVLFLVPVINDPDSTLSVVLSLIPPFTPLLMMLRIAVKMPPLWQLAAGYLGSAVFTLGVLWLAARIYRVGILMYGKKPTFGELWKWIRYA